MKKKLSILVIAVLLLSVAVTGGVWAFLKEHSSTVTNTFSMAPVISIEEKDDKGESFDVGDLVKKEVKVKVESTSTPLYIRAKVVFTKQNDSGETLAEIPVAETDYVSSFNVGTKPGQWTELGGYYYYNGTVDSNATTGILINSVTTKLTDAKLCVDVLAQAVEATPEAAGDTWGMTVNAAGTGWS